MLDKGISFKLVQNEAEKEKPAKKPKNSGCDTSCKSLLETKLFKNYILPWKESAYNGSIMMVISIFNVLCIPFMQYDEMII